MEEEERIPQVTSGKEWRDQEEAGELVVLPSGRRVRLRHVEFEDLVAEGRLPDPLTALVNESIKGGEFKIEVSLEGFRHSIELANTYCRLAFLQPRIVDDPQADDEIALRHVKINDRLWVLQWAQGGVESYKPFREKQVGDVQTLDDIPELQPETIGNSGD